MPVLSYWLMRLADFFSEVWRVLNPVKQSAAARKGEWAETQALWYLRRAGLHYRHRNYFCRFSKGAICRQGELDLIMQQGDQIVFVEVRYREHGKALSSIGRKKQACLKLCVDEYMHKQRLKHLSYRFDVVTLEPEGNTWRIKWYRNVFLLVKG